MGFFKTPKEQFEAFMVANNYVSAVQLVYQQKLTDMEFVVKGVESAWKNLKEKNELGQADQLLYLFDKYLVPTQDGRLVPKVKAPEVTAPEKAAIAKDRPELVVLVVFVTMLWALSTATSALIHVDRYGNVRYSWDYRFVLAVIGIVLAVYVYKGKNWARDIICVGWILYFAIGHTFLLFLSFPVGLTLFILVALFPLLLFTKKASLFFKRIPENKGTDAQSLN
ncbi:MAG: hypothetical protein HY207_06480 [Nitrospirae bacterium]|nr:hypothetical protein [Nitrospirota bacterium]